MKKLATILLFAILGFTGYAQNDKFTSYESMFGKTVYFYANDMVQHNTFAIYVKNHNGKFVSLVSSASKAKVAKEIAQVFIPIPLSSSERFDYSILNGLIEVCGIVEDKFGKLLMIKKDGVDYYFELNDSNDYLSYIVNPEAWELQCSELNEHYKYYIKKKNVDEEEDQIIEIHWSIEKQPQSIYQEVLYEAKATHDTGRTIMKGCSYSEIKEDSTSFLNEFQKNEREKLKQQEQITVDGLSRQGFVSVGRFHNYSIRVFERNDSLVLCIGLENDTNGNINLRYLRIEPKNYPSFEKNMAIVNEKYANWSLTAKKDRVTNFKKKIPVDFDDEVGYLTMGFSKEYRHTDLFAVFEVDENGNTNLRLDDWEEYDSRNSSFRSQMHSPYFYFNSPEEFSRLFELIRYDNLLANYKRAKQIVDEANQAKKDRDAKFN